jgi:predicted nuclease of predicted toxin-antitoxin system
MKFLIDNQLPVTLSKFLNEKGFHASHVYGLGMDSSKDIDIFRFAKANGFVLISKDDDFFHLSLQHSEAPQLIWIRIGNCRTSALLNKFDSLLPEILKALELKERIIEVR